MVDYSKYFEKYTPEELVEAFVFPHDLTLEEKEKSDIEMREFRFKLLAGMTDADKLRSALIRFRIIVENFIQNDISSEKKNFSTFFQEYLDILGKKQVDFAKEISLHSTKLNQILRDKQMPNIALMYRLEKHSGGIIPAILWWKLFNKKIEANIKNDTVTRAKEMDKVKYCLNFD